MAFAFVNIAEGVSDGSAGTIASGAQNHTAGRLLIVFVQNEDSRTVSQVQDTAGNSYTQRGTNSSGTTRQSVWTAFSITGNATNVVTATLSGNATFRRIRVLQYSYANVAAFHDSDVGTGSGAEFATANSTATANAQAVIAACVFFGSNFDGVVAGTDFILRGSTDEVDTATEDRIVSATGTYNATMSNEIEADWMMIHVIVVETPAPATSRASLRALLGVG